MFVCVADFFNTGTIFPTSTELGPFLPAPKTVAVRTHWLQQSFDGCILSSWKDTKLKAEYQ